MKDSILTSDLHLTTSPRDAYRWGLFPWLAEQAKKLRVRRLIILGDLTNAKDHHPSLLVNQVVQAVQGVIEYANLEETLILRGNHDGVDPEWPYFRWLNELPRVRFIYGPQTMTIGDRRVTLLPHSRAPGDEWEAAVRVPVDTVLMHATVEGAEAEGGQHLLGLSPDFVRKFKAKNIWAGDVHVPQKCGPVQYIGAPYPIRFGDSFRPRVVHLNHRGEDFSLFPPTIRRLMLHVSDPDELAAVITRKGDQAKVRVRMERSQYGRWKAWKSAVHKWAHQQRVELVSVELVPQPSQSVPQRKPTPTTSPKQLFLDYCRQAEVGKELRESGRTILEDNGGKS